MREFHFVSRALSCLVLKHTQLDDVTFLPQTFVPPTFVPPTFVPPSIRLTFVPPIAKNTTFVPPIVKKTTLVPPS